jgi:hypothetical protein
MALANFQIDGKSPVSQMFEKLVMDIVGATWSVMRLIQLIQFNFFKTIISFLEFRHSKNVYPL